MGAYGKPIRPGEKIELARGTNAAGEHFVCWVLDLGFSTDGLLALLRVLDFRYRNELKFSGRSKVLRFKFGDTEETDALPD